MRLGVDKVDLVLNGISDEEMTLLENGLKSVQKPESNTSAAEADKNQPDTKTNEQPEKGESPSVTAIQKL